MAYCCNEMLYLLSLYLADCLSDGEKRYVLCESMIECTDCPERELPVCQQTPRYANNNPRSEMLPPFST